MWALGLPPELPPYDEMASSDLVKQEIPGWLRKPLRIGHTAPRGRDRRGPQSRPSFGTGGAARDSSLSRVIKTPRVRNCWRSASGLTRTLSDFLPIAARKRGKSPASTTTSACEERPTGSSMPKNGRSCGPSLWNVISLSIGFAATLQTTNGTGPRPTRSRALSSRARARSWSGSAPIEYQPGCRALRPSRVANHFAVI